VLDVGFGDGRQMRHLRDAACRPYGVEHNPGLAAKGRGAGLTVCRAQAEALPFADGVFDGVVCKVVIPYTDEARAIAEIARVLRPDGVARVSFHGLGYSLRYLLQGSTWKRRVYAARVIVNTIVYALTGKRLPGFVGDTLYQGRRRLLRYYRKAGLDVISEHPSATFAGAPVFIYHTLRRAPVASPAVDQFDRASGRS
jgi:SAM-dependent methyltransferase